MLEISQKGPFQKIAEVFFKQPRFKNWQKKERILFEKFLPSECVSKRRRERGIYIEREKEKERERVPLKPQFACDVYL